jgi:hypothetical protein
MKHTSSNTVAAQKMRDFMATSPLEFIRSLLPAYIGQLLGVETLGYRSQLKKHMVSTMHFFYTVNKAEWTGFFLPSPNTDQPMVQLDSTTTRPIIANFLKSQTLTTPQIAAMDKIFKAASGNINLSIIKENSDPQQLKPFSQKAQPVTLYPVFYFALFFPGLFGQWKNKRFANTCKKS